MLLELDNLAIVWATPGTKFSLPFPIITSESVGIELSLPIIRPLVWLFLLIVVVPAQSLFELVNLLNDEIGLSDEDIELLKKKYNRISISTLSQLKRLGLDKEKRLCTNYLKVFERFDEKKNEKLNEILGLIEK